MTQCQVRSRKSTVRLTTAISGVRPSVSGNPKIGVATKLARSAIVLGAGRSGTSLLAGLFQKSGYFSGNSLLAGSVSNPLGYFEDKEINAINEDLLAGAVPWRPRGVMGAALYPVRVIGPGGLRGGLQ